MKLMTSDPKTGRCAKLKLTGPQGAAGGEAGEGDAGMEKEEGRERTGPELLSGVASFDFQSGLGQTQAPQHAANPAGEDCSEATEGA